MDKSFYKLPVVRKKRKYKCPNPLFEAWLTEWKDEAASKGLYSRYNFARALSSLKKYPLPLLSGKEAKILEHFGDKICKMLDERLEQHRSEYLGSGTHIASNTLFAGTSSMQCAAKSKASSKTKPSPNNKRKAKPISHNPKNISPKKPNVPLPSVESSSAAVYIPPAATSEDVVLEERGNDLVSESSFLLYPGEFDIFLCVDNCETLSGQSKSRKKFLEELKSSGMNFLTRKLNVGDFLWIAKEKSDGLTVNNARELVLDFIIERKRLDDLAQSIKDGRFREQKFRLKASGLRRPIYLVEEHKQGYMGLPESTLEQAIVNTQIVDGFTIKRTKDIKESVAYLSSMTMFLQNTFQQRILKSTSRDEMEKSTSSNSFLTFIDFNKGSVKNKVFTVGEMFIKHLLQFHGISPDRAKAIVDHFETPIKFFQALQSCSSENERIKMLSDIKYGKYQKSIGQSIAKVLQQYYVHQ